MSTADSSKVRAYLLGALPEPERSALEEQYFADDQLFELVNEMEDELIRDYVAGSLGATDRTQFERHLSVTPALREKVEEAKILAEELKPHLPPVAVAARSIAPETQESWTDRLAGLFGFGPRMAWGAAAASLLVAAVAGVVSVRTSDEVRSLQAKIEALSQRTIGSVATIVVAAAGDRGDSTERIRLDARATVLELEIPSEGAPAGTIHQAVLKVVGGEQICSQRLVTVAGRPLTMAVPRSSMQDGQEYRVDVTRADGRSFSYGLSTARTVDGTK